MLCLWICENKLSSLASDSALLVRGCPAQKTEGSNDSGPAIQFLAPEAGGEGWGANMERGKKRWDPSEPWSRAHVTKRIFHANYSRISYAN